MDPVTILSIASMTFQGLGGVTSLLSPLLKMTKLFGGSSKYDLVTPFPNTDPLQMHYAYLFQIAQLQAANSPYFFSPFATGYPPGFPPVGPIPNPYLQQPLFSQQPQSNNSSNLFKEHFPTLSKVFSFSSSSGSSHHSLRHSKSASFASYSHHFANGGFSGSQSMIQLIKEQEANDTYIDDGLGMGTGGVPLYTDSAAVAHWNLFQRSGHGVSGSNSTIAVLDWTARLITMYVRSGTKYYRNYRVSEVDVASFASTFQHNRVCSGIIRHQQVEAINKPMPLVPDRMQYGRVISSNCWTFLGFPCSKERLEELGPVFMEVPRGSVFGILNCLYKAPHRLNVDMKRLAYNLDRVHVDCLGEESALSKNPASDCAFTVFEFATNGWAHDKVLVG